MMDTAAVAERQYRADGKQPKVSIVMLLSPRREAMAERALRCVAAQSYQNIELIAFYTSELKGQTIGALRNIANSKATGDLIAHADDDDWFHARRIEEQVALLLASGKQVVGFRELLFWDTRVAQIEVDPTRPGPEGHGCLGIVRSVGEAWIYRNHQANYATGASFLYRRELWEQQPFDDAPHEDRRWWLTPLVSRNCIGVTGIRGGGSATLIESTVDDKPRMICQLHGSNSEAYDRGVMLRNPDVWRRAEHWDKYCERTMKL